MPKIDSMVANATKIKSVEGDSVTAGLGLKIEDNPGEQNQGASVKMMITKADKATLKDLGYTHDQVSAMKPNEAQQIIENRSMPEQRESVINKNFIADSTKIKPGTTVIWTNKTGEPISGSLVEKKKGSQSIWKVKKDDGKHTYVSEKIFQANEAPQMESDVQSVHSDAVTDFTDLKQANEETTTVEPGTTAKENLAVEPGGKITWQEKGQSFSGALVQKKPGAKSLWWVKKANGDTVLVNEKDFIGVEDAKYEDLHKNLPKGTIVGGAKEISQLYDDVAAGKIKGNEKKAVRFQVIGKEEATRLKKDTGLDLEGYKHTVDSFGLKHAHEGHKDQLSQADYSKIPDIINNYDKVEYSGQSKRTKLDTVKYTKRYNGETYYVEEVRTGRQELTIKSMYKARTANDVVTHPHSLRPERNSRSLIHKGGKTRTVPRATSKEGVAHTSETSGSNLPQSNKNIPEKQTSVKQSSNKFPLQNQVVDAETAEPETSSVKKSPQPRASVTWKGNKDETLYSTTQDRAPGQGISLDDIRSRFKGQTIAQDGDSLNITLKNGLNLKVTAVEHIGGDDYRFAVETGKMDKDGQIVGKATAKGFTLNKNLADSFTRDHELTHTLELAGILKEEDLRILDNKAKALSSGGIARFKWSKDVRENRANAMAQLLKDRSHVSQGSRLSHILQKVSDFLDGILHIGRQSARKLAREVESGKVFGRVPGEKSDATQFQTTENIKNPGPGPTIKKAASTIKKIVTPKEGSTTTGLAGIDNVYDAAENKWFSEKDYELHKNQVENVNLQQDLLKIMGREKYDKEAKDMDQAIHIYLDLKRNPDHLSQYYKDLNPEDQAIVDLAQTIDKKPRLKALADQIADAYQALGEKAEAEGVINQTIENYVGRTWKQNKKASNQVFQKFVTKSRHSKQRVFETILEGLATGMELQVKGATNNLRVVKDEIAKVIEDKKLLNTLQKTEHLDTGEMIFTDKTGLEGYKKLQGHNFTVWKPYGNVKGGRAKDTFINDKGKEIKLGKNAMIQTRFAVENPETGRAFKVFDQKADALKWQQEAGKGVIKERTVLWEKRQLWAPEAITDRLNKITGRSVLSGKFKVGGVSVVDTLTKYNAVAKSTLLMTGLFHHQAFMRSYLFGVNHKTKAEWNPIKAYKEGMQAVKNLDKEVEMGVRNGLTLGLMQDWQEDLLSTTDTVFGRVMDKYKVAKGIKDKLNDLRERQAKFLFGELGAGLKAKAFIIEYRNAAREYPEMEENERARMVAGLINADFGGLHLGRMGRDPSLQHIFRLFALAPDWTESNIITMVKAVKAGNKAETNMYRKFWASVFTKSMIATFAMNVALSLAAGDDDEEFMDKFKRSWKAGHLKWMDVNITPIYKAMGGKEEAEKYFSLIGHFRDPIKFIVHPITSAKHKGSVLYRFFHEMMAGEDWKGAQFTTFSELVGVDDKGVYLTNRRGHHRAGDPKGGKLKGQTVSYRSDAKNGPIGFSQVPSYLVAQGKGVLPIQIQNLLGWMAGEVNWFDAITKGAGFYVSSTYPTPKTIEQTFVDQVVQARLHGGNIRDIAAKISAYNKRRKAAGKIDEKILWKDVIKKAKKVLWAQKLSERR